MNQQPQTYLDQKFASFLADRSGLVQKQRDIFYDLVARLSLAMREGHSCLQVAKNEQELLRKCHLVKVIGQADNQGICPLVLHGSNLYLQKYYNYESRLAAQVVALAQIRYDVKENDLQTEKLFPGESVHTSDQMRAAVTALNRAFMVVSGGPGTGKTTTVVKMLSLLLLNSDTSMRIGLAAPTGKAAMRLSESIGKALEGLDLPSEVKEYIPTNGVTLHRLLGVKKHSPHFVHNSQNPMSYDVVVVDEASMVDLAMMSKLVDALKPEGRLFLLGDKDQLASIESGSVLSDFIGGLPDSSIGLKKTYRFERSIKDLAEGVNDTNHKAVWSQLTAGAENVTLIKEEGWYGYIVDRYSEYLRFAQNKEESSDTRILDIFKKFNKFQVLCSVAYTDRGVRHVNRTIEQLLALKGLQCKHEDWYQGRPVLITQNDYSLDLFNGDIGICLWDNDKKEYRIWFDGVGGKLKSCFVSLLPPHETVYAMTIHKSQGSEFEEVLVVLPREDNRVLSRELVYTGITRAQKAVRVLAEYPVLKLALQRQHDRHSGLLQMLQSQLQ